MLFPTWRRVTSWAILLQFCILSFAQAEIFKTIPADEIPKVGFPPDTLVWTYDSAGQTQLSSIKDCVQGQEVASVNIETGRIEPATIVGALLRTSSLVEIDLEQNCDGATQSYTMCLCAEHKILSPTLEKFKIVHAWREAQDLQPDHLVWTYNPTTQSRLRLARVVAVRKSEQCNINSPVVCLSLDKNHNFLVGPSGLVAHNFCFPFPFTIGITISLEGSRLVITGLAVAIGTAFGWLGTYVERNKNNKPQVTPYYSPNQSRAATGGPDPDDDKRKERKKNVKGPAESKVWNELKNDTDGWKTNGLSGSHRRYYRWDRTHNDIEVYLKDKKTLLYSIDPTTGEPYRWQK